MKIIQQSVKLLWITENPEFQIERSSRLCYKSEDNMKPESSGEFCKKMKRLGHHAMIEHAVASFRIITDRGISHEIVRHRIASFAQESTRYCNYSNEKFGNEIEVIEPPGLDNVQRGYWLLGCEYSEPVHVPEGMLRCRRYAPRPGSDGEEPTRIMWPLVEALDWCGEFLERETLEEGS